MISHFDADEAPHPLGDFEKEELISYANALLTGANTRLQTGNIAGACWRIADALGALSFAAEPDTGGIDRFTGLGFRLLKVNEVKPETKEEGI
jgi:hypothetical protein